MMQVCNTLVMDKCLTTSCKIFTLLTNVTLGFGRVANNRA